MFWNREKRKNNANAIIRQLRDENRQLAMENKALKELFRAIEYQSNRAQESLQSCPEYQEQLVKLNLMTRQALMPPEEALRLFHENGLLK